MLDPAHVNFSNRTEAVQFLHQLLKAKAFHLDFVPRLYGFWYAVIIVVCITGIWQFFWRFLLRLRRLQAARAQSASPGIVARVYGSIIAVVRRVIYPQWSPLSTASWFIIPPLGTTGLILGYFLFMLLLLFIDIQVTGPTWYTEAGIRAGFLAVIQIPLILSLAGKNNLISLLTGVSYERLNIYHRWVARGCFLMVTLHFAMLSDAWNQFPGLTALEWEIDEAFRSGVAAYVILAWMNISTVLPLRDWCYEFFLFQHVLTFFGFIIATAVHIPAGPKDAFYYIYVGIGLYVVERLVSGLRFAYHNIRPGRATLEALPGSATRIRVSNCRIKSWTPGAHALISIPGMKLGQSHPATILSTPTSHNGDMVFILRAYGGFTKHIHTAAKTGSSAPPTEPETQPSAQLPTYRALVNGPYAASHADFASFDTVYLIAGATGITFTLPILLDLARRAASQRLPVRRIEFIWMIRDEAWAGWVSDELEAAERDFASAGLAFNVSIYVTGGTSTTEVSTEKQAVVTEKDVKIPKDGGVVETMHHPSRVLRSGRPDWSSILAGLDKGESAVGVCGPLGLSMAIRKQVVSLGGVYLHVESFM